MYISCDLSSDKLHVRFVVFLQMPGQTEGLRKHLVALIALVSFCAGMQIQVPLQMIRQFESLAA